MATQEELLAWVDEERTAIWADFVNASRRAARTPDPRDPAFWSMEMEWLIGRIRSASALLGQPTSWRELNVPAYPYYAEIEGVPLPVEAWAYVEGLLSSADYEKQARWVLQFRPAEAKS